MVNDFADTFPKLQKGNNIRVKLGNGDVLEGYVHQVYPETETFVLKVDKKFFIIDHYMCDDVEFK